MVQSVSTNSKVESIGKLKNVTAEKNQEFHDLFFPLTLIAIYIFTLKKVWVGDWNKQDDPFSSCSALTPACFTILYLGGIYFGQRFMEERRPLENLRPYMLAYNMFQTLFNVWWILKCTYVVLTNGISIASRADKTPLGWPLGYLIWMHYNNKYLELLDTAFMVLRKKTKQVSFLHVYHHLLMMWSWWLVVRYECGGSAWFGSFLNSMIHTLMYSYYALALLKVPCPWKRSLTKLQLAQFVCVFGQSIYLFYLRMTLPEAEADIISPPTYLILVQSFAMVTLFLLFAAFYRKAYQVKRADGEKKEK
eukprot:g3721.t1